MTGEQAVEAVVAGIEIVGEQRGRGLDIVATGDMGIGNTTSAAAITSVLAGAEVSAVVGRGTGLDEPGLGRKVAAVEQALATNQPDGSDGLDVLAKVGGYEIGMLTGVILGAAAARIAVVLDGYISGAAALVAQAVGPEAIAYCVAGHRSSEPGHGVALERLGLRPYLDLEMRLGEGTGAVLLFALVEASARIMSEMATFAEADVPPRTE